MVKAGEGYASDETPDDTVSVAPGGHGGSSVKQGMAGQSMRAAERGRDEFQGNGASAELDPGRTTEGGRHYGRPAGEHEPPDEATVDVLEAEAPEGAPPPARTQGRHGGASILQPGRDAGRHR
jgi:hypothetical protein